MYMQVCKLTICQNFLVVIRCTFWRQVTWSYIIHEADISYLEEARTDSNSKQNFDIMTTVNGETLFF